MSRWYLVLGLTVALFDEGAAAANCTENCALCNHGCVACKQGYYKTEGKCEKCNPNCKRCYSTGLCYFECKDGWYGLSCSHACSCSYGTCDKYIGVCPHQTDPPVSSAHNHNFYDDESFAGKLFGVLAFTIFMMVICCCCMKRKKKRDEEQMADDTPDIIPPSQNLLPGQTPITTRSTNITYPNFFAGNFSTYTSNNGNGIMCPPQRRDLAPPPCATYSDQQMDPAPPPCATYSGQQMDQTPPPCVTFNGQQTDTDPPPSYTASVQRANMPPPPSYESLFDSNRERTQEPFIYENAPRL
ncbi:uncharacterized protein LOC124291345 [Haliotis rubra]|uniref:uncharacterized protein LOC124291345 n=1 Tax=Haliotis rubra TaxID=36100 RepID=UPI001EE60CCF|nr:uncharacterized protein LOC124291345 [Haliotis rubra]